jgi:hypothetical protein
MLWTKQSYYEFVMLRTLLDSQWNERYTKRSPSRWSVSLQKEKEKKTDKVAPDLWNQPAVHEF